MYAPSVGSTGHGVRLRFPVTTRDVDRLGVRYGFANVRGNRACASFRDGLHDRVVDGLLASLVVWHIHGVVDRALLGFPYRTTNRVRNRLGVSFPNGLHDRVVNRLLTCLVVRHVDRVATRLGLVHEAS